MKDLFSRVRRAYARTGRWPDGRQYAPSCHDGIVVDGEQIVVRNSFQVLRRYVYDAVRDRLRSVPL